MQRFLDRRYALALYMIAKDKGLEENFIYDLKQIQDVIDNNKSFKEIIENPNINKFEKKKIFHELFDDKTYDEIISFLCVLIEKDRIMYLSEKIKQLELINYEENNMLRGIVKTAIPLTNDEYRKILLRLEIRYNKKIILDQIIDKTIIAGVYIKISDDIMDGTIRSKLEDIKRYMNNRM